MGRKKNNPVVETPVAEAPVVEAPAVAVAVEAPATVSTATVVEAPVVVVEDSAPAEGVPMIVKLERAISSVLTHQMGNNATMHNLRAKLMDALKSVK